ncbi:hypothetical protein [Micromonospora sp. IBSANI012]|uniref:hypothetical protein n=1 Tax=Micromonospora sp. IBSANI012 TaxID=3457761 RepID=UPI0040597DC9
MDEISRELRVAVADAPPSRIDVDQLIAADRQRRRHRTWVWSGTGVAAAVAVAVVTPVLIAGGPAPRTALPPAIGSPTAGPATAVKLCTGVTPKPTGPQPPLQSYGTVRPRPTEEPAAGVARLTAALRDGLRTRLPAGVRLDPAQKGCTEPQFQYHPSYREYEVGATVRRGKESGFFLLRVAPTPREESTPDCARAMNSEDCRIVRFPDGSTAMLSRLEAERGQWQFWAFVARPDGTSVLAITNNFRSQPVGNQMQTSTTADTPLLTMDQLVEITRAPGLTLYP